MLTNFQISNIYKGSTPVNKVMLNGAVVWPTKPVFTFETKETSVITLTAITDNDAIVSDYDNYTIAHAVELGDFPAGGDYKRVRSGYWNAYDYGTGVNNPTMIITGPSPMNYNYFGITTAINFDGTVIAGVGGLNELEADGIPRGRVRVYKANYDNNNYEQLGSHISIHENFNAPTRFPEWNDTQNKYTYTTPNRSFWRYSTHRNTITNMNTSNDGSAYNGTAPDDIRFGIHFDTTIRLDDSGTRIAISAPWAATSSTTTKKAQGLVRVFDYNSENNSWEQVGNDIWGERELAILGMNLQMAGNGMRILVSHQKQRENSIEFDFFQRVYDYDQSSNQWIQKGKDLITTETYQEEANDYVSSNYAPRRAPDFSLGREPRGGTLMLAGNGESIYYSPVTELRFDESRDDWVVVGPHYIGAYPLRTYRTPSQVERVPEQFYYGSWMVDGIIYETVGDGEGLPSVNTKTVYYDWDANRLDEPLPYRQNIPEPTSNEEAYGIIAALEPSMFIMDRSGKAYNSHKYDTYYYAWGNPSAGFISYVINYDTTAIYIKTGEGLLDQEKFSAFTAPRMTCDMKITPLYGATVAMLGDYNEQVLGQDADSTASPQFSPGTSRYWRGYYNPAKSSSNYPNNYPIWYPYGWTGFNYGTRGTTHSRGLEIFYSARNWKDVGEDTFSWVKERYYPLQGNTFGCSVQISGDGTTVIAGEATTDRIFIYKRKPVGDRITSIRSSGTGGSTENNRSYDISGENNRAIAVKHSIADKTIIAYFRVTHARAFNTRYFNGVPDRYRASVILTKIVNTTDNDINISVECNGITHTLKAPPGRSFPGLLFKGILPGHTPGDRVKKDMVVTNLDAGVETREKITFKTSYVYTSYDNYIIPVGGSGAGSENLSRTINLYTVSHLDVVNNADRPFTLKRDALVAQYESTDSALKAVYFGDQQLESLTIRNHKGFTVMQTDKTGTRSVIYERPDWLTTVQTPLFYTIHGSGVNYTYNT